MCIQGNDDFLSDNASIACEELLIVTDVKMVEPIFDYQFRLILIGDSTVGKSSLLKYFTDGKFAEVRSDF